MFCQTWAWRQSQIFKVHFDTWVDTDGGRRETGDEDKMWLTHLSFAHVGQRLFKMFRRSCRVSRGQVAAESKEEVNTWRNETVLDRWEQQLKTEGDKCLTEEQRKEENEMVWLSKSVVPKPLFQNSISFWLGTFVDYPQTILQHKETSILKCSFLTLIHYPIIMTCVKHLKMANKHVLARYTLASGGELICVLMTNSPVQLSVHCILQLPLPSLKTQNKCHCHKPNK